MQTENGLCGKHSGVCVEVENLKESDRNQWSAINAMKTRSIVTMTAVVMTLFGVVINLVILLSVKGVHP